MTSLSLAHWAMLVSAALFAGMVDAMAGGGGLVTLPALLSTGMPPHLALGTNKAQAIWGTSMALFTFVRAKKVSARFVRWALPLGFVGAVIGARSVVAVSPSALRVAVMVLLAAAALFVWRQRSTTVTDQQPPVRRVGVVVAVFVIGAYDGFLGPGTGTFLIAALAFWGHAGLASASAHAKVVNLASNAAALAIFAWFQHVSWGVALPMAAAQLVGGRIGAYLVLRHGGRFVRLLVMLATGALLVKLGVDLCRAW